MAKVRIRPVGSVMVFLQYSSDGNRRGNGILEYPGIGRDWFPVPGHPHAFWTNHPEKTEPAIIVSFRIFSGFFSIRNGYGFFWTFQKIFSGFFFT